MNTRTVISPLMVGTVVHIPVAGGHRQRYTLRANCGERWTHEMACARHGFLFGQTECGPCKWRDLSDRRFKWCSGHGAEVLA